MEGSKNLPPLSIDLSLNRLADYISMHRFVKEMENSLAYFLAVEHLVGLSLYNKTAYVILLTPGKWIECASIQQHNIKLKAFLLIGNDSNDNTLKLQKSVVLVV